jgi:hypothetical protein
VIVYLKRLVVASATAAKKTFYNLDVRRDRLITTPPDDMEGFWIASGFVEELTRVDASPSGYSRLKAFCNFGAIGGARNYVTRNSFDYVEFPISSPEPGSPHNFGGMSGSGLWHIPLDDKSDGSLLVREHLLQGIVYYQDPYVESESRLHCHGTRSIYVQGHTALAS